MVQSAKSIALKMDGSGRKLDEGLIQEWRMNNKKVGRSIFVFYCLPFFPIFSLLDLTTFCHVIVGSRSRAIKF